MRKETINKKDTPVKKGDLVMVLTGKESGKTGKIIEVLPKKERVLIEKLNFVKRHSKPTQTHRQGGIIEKEASIHWSNVALMCAKCNKPSRKRIKKDKVGKKSRVCAKCGEQFETIG
jgi:large subunit ribosomal protein L24